jgi:hypothetical protein
LEPDCRNVLGGRLGGSRRLLREGVGPGVGQPVLVLHTAPLSFSLIKVAFHLDGCHPSVAYTVPEKFPSMGVLAVVPAGPLQEALDNRIVVDYNGDVPKGAKDGQLDRLKL